MRLETHTVTASDDTPLATCRWTTPAATDAIVIIVHGMAEHGLRYAAFAEQLAAARLTVYAFDLRGHGTTTPAVDHGYLGSDTTWQTLLADVDAVRTFATDLDGPCPVILFGHGLGSFIVQATLQTHGCDYAGAILSAPANPARWRCRLGALVAAMEAVLVDPTGQSRLLQRLTFDAYDNAIAKHLHTPHSPCAWLSSDRAAADGYIADEQTGFAMRTATWQCLLRGMAHTQSPHNRRRTPADLPLLIAAGSDDPIGRFGKAPRALANAYLNNGQHDVTLRLYAGARHEIINDSRADSVVHDILDWLAQRNLTITAPTHTGSSTPCDD